MWGQRLLIAALAASLRLGQAEASAALSTPVTAAKWSSIANEAPTKPHDANAKLQRLATLRGGAFELAAAEGTVPLLGSIGAVAGALVLAASSGGTSAATGERARYAYQAALLSVVLKGAGQLFQLTGKHGARILLSNNRAASSMAVRLALCAGFVLTWSPPPLRFSLLPLALREAVLLMHSASSSSSVLSTSPLSRAAGVAAKLPTSLLLVGGHVAAASLQSDKAVWQAAFNKWLVTGRMWAKAMGTALLASTYFYSAFGQADRERTLLHSAMHIGTMGAAAGMLRTHATLPGNDVYSFLPKQRAVGVAILALLPLTQVYAPAMNSLLWHAVGHLCILEIAVMWRKPSKEASAAIAAGLTALPTLVAGARGMRF